MTPRSASLLKRVLTAAKIAAALFTVAWVVVSWVEANREIRVLCSMFEPGQSLSQVVATLDTGAYLRYHVSSPDEGRVKVSSVYNGLHTACTVTLADGHVSASTHRTRAQAYVLFGE